jgi:hypothetical protein
LKPFCLPPLNSGDWRSSKAGFSPVTFAACPKALLIERPAMIAEADIEMDLRSRTFMRLGFERS